VLVREIASTSSIIVISSTAYWWKVDFQRFRQFRDEGGGVSQSEKSNIRIYVYVHARVRSTARIHERVRRADGVRGSEGWPVPNTAISENVRSLGGADIASQIGFASINLKSPWLPLKPHRSSNAIFANHIKAPFLSNSRIGFTSLANARSRSDER